MKEFSKIFNRYLIVLTSIIFIQACGGGGSGSSNGGSNTGGSGTGGSTPPQTDTNFSISSDITSINFVNEVLVQPTATQELT